jgi:hypothetical protein
MRALEPDNPRWKAQEGDHGPQASNLAKVTEITAMTRRVFDQILTASDIAGTNGSCLYGSILLSQLLGKFGECEARVCGGDGQADGGAADPSGGWHGHYWVERKKRKAGLEFVADITADQFHWPPVVVLPAEQARYRYRPGGADKVAQDVREIEAEIDEQGARVLERGWGAAMSEGVLEMVMAAVNVARFESVRRVASLRSILTRRFPGREADIDSAIQYWANYEKSKVRP